jgi:hypothetical protein
MLLLRHKIFAFLLAAAAVESPSVLTACNICGGGTNDIVILALDGRALVNFGFSYDNYAGVWNEYGIWRPSSYSTPQVKFALSAAYRINKHLQFGLTIPFLMNYSNIPGVKSEGKGLGDISLTGRYEFFHEFQVRKGKDRSEIDKVLPYLAVTFGITLPTGKSEETAENEVDITGKGFLMTSLGFSLTKSLIRNRLQISTDFSWQHCFEKSYDKYFGEDLGSPYTKRLGDKFNYGVSLNYIFGSEHAVGLAVSGFSQTPYFVNDQEGRNSSERALTFAMAYTYYPTLQFRITPSVRWIIPSDNVGKNATGSTTFSVNFTYYFPDYTIK